MKPICFVCLFVALQISAFAAKDLTAYHIGDVPAEDISAPAALDVTSSNSTIASRPAETPGTPVVFRVYSTTNILTKEFLAAFARARSNFLAAIQDAFHQATLDEKSIASPDFGYLITAFNVENKNFPVTDELAADWARGGSGQATQNTLLDSLLKMERLYARPDELPKNFAIGQILRLVPASTPDEKLSLDDAEHGELVAESNVSTISNVRVVFCRGFSADEKPLSHAVSGLLKPNCIPDVELTQLARDHTAGQTGVIEHYKAGQLIVQRGAIINAQTKSALDELQKRSAFALPVNNSTRLLLENTTVTASETANPEKKPVKILNPDAWLIAAILVVSVAVPLMLARRRKTSPSPIRAIKFSPQTPVLLQPELAPIVQAVKDTFVRELALQRRELILAQQQAAAEIVELIRRLDKLQVPMQERLKAYEFEIQRLEKELAERTEENRELIKYRIELTRQQLEVERSSALFTN